MLKQGNNITTDIRIGGSQIGTVYLGSVKLYPGLVRTEVGVHYDTGPDTYIGWDRYNIYYYRDVLTWSNGTVTYENLRTENTLTQANAYTEVDKLKTVGTAFWPSGWDKYRTDVYQTWRTRGDGYADWIGAPREVPVLVESNAYTLGAYYHEDSTPTVCTNYGVAPYSQGYHRIMARNRIRFDGYQEANEIDRYIEAEWQTVATNVVACGYNPLPLTHDVYIRAEQINLNWYITASEAVNTKITIKATIIKEDVIELQNFALFAGSSRTNPILISGLRGLDVQEVTPSQNGNQKYIW